MIKDFYIDENNLLDEVRILMTGFGVLIDFVTYNPKYFQDAKIISIPPLWQE